MAAKAKRRSPRGENRRIVILREASLEFAARGYRAASLATIAERAGITQSGLLHHYPTKDQLLEAVLQQRFTEDAKLLDEVAAATTTTAPYTGYRLLAERNAQNPTWVRFLTVMAAEGLTEDHPSRAAMTARYGRIRARFLARIEQQYAAGFVRDDLDQHVLASLLVAAMDGLQLQWLYDPSIDMAAGLELLTSLWLPEQPSTGSAEADAEMTAAASA